MDYLINEPVSIEDIDFNHINDDIPRYGDEFDYNGETSDWCVYVHINKINNKMYFGVSSNLKDRWYSNGEKYKGCKVFYKAIQKYGFDSFKHFVLMNGLTETIAKAIENYLIIKYHSFAEDETGYNVLHDQSNPFSNTHDDNFHSHSTSAIPIHQYDMNGIYIQSFSCLNEAMMTVKGNYIGDSIKKCLSREHPFAYGFLWSLELVDQMEPYRPNDSKYWDEYHKAENEFGPVVKLSNDGELIKIFKNINYTADTVKERQQIQRCCHGHYITAYGFIWMFYRDYCIDEKRESKIAWQKNFLDGVLLSKKVIQYDIDGNKIKEFQSIKKAAESINLKYQNISDVCSERYGTAGGFQWRYSTDPAPGKFSNDRGKCKKPIIQYDRFGNQIATYDSIKSASLETKISNYRISQCAHGKSSGTDGYIWKFVS